MPKTKVAITLDAELLERVDELVARRDFRNRSQAVEAALAEKLARARRGCLTRECAKLDGGEEKARFTGATTKREAVVTALRDFNRRRRMAALAKHFGEQPVTSRRPTSPRSFPKLEGLLWDHHARSKALTASAPGQSRGSLATIPRRERRPRWA
jgi:Arc/MetJ-type ribon-helix-helix transcriptional regulator